MSPGRIVFAALLALGLAVAAGAAQAPQATPPMQIQFAEKVNVALQPGHLEFDAYGRRFVLELESNERLLKAFPAARKATLARAKLLRGRLAGVPNSWVRLSRVGGSAEGAIWDGHDLYAITSRSRIERFLVAPLAAQSDDTVVYRLSDTINGLPAEFCGLAKEAVTGQGASALQQYQGLVQQLRTASAATLTDQVELSMVADSAFQADFGANSDDEMLARLNIVDGIFAEQVGMLILATDLRLVPAGSDPMTATDASALLDQFATYRSSTPAVKARGLAHLFTGKDLDGLTNGIAYVGKVCDERLAVSLSDNTWATLTAAQVMAHELGHNFGARHDSEAGSVCESTPDTYLMSPTVNGSGTFSACSLDTMAPVIAAARGRCIVAPSYADLAAAGPSGAITTDDLSSFTAAFSVHSGGTLAAQAAELHVTLPSSISFQSGNVTGGSCTANGANVTCTLGTLAPGEDRTVNLQLYAAQTGSMSLSARTVASNDVLSGNDVASVPLVVRSGIDVSVAMRIDRATVYPTDVVEFTIDVTANRSRAAHGATLLLDMAGTEFVSATAGNNTCNAQLGADVECQLEDLLPGASTRVVIRARAKTVGTWTQTAHTNVTGDGDSANNNVSAQLVISPEDYVGATPDHNDIQAVIGASYDIAFTLKAGGRRISNNVRFDIGEPTTGHFSVLSVSAGTCVRNPPAVSGGRASIDCDFGNLNPGDVRTFVLRLQVNSAGYDTIVQTTSSNTSTSASTIAIRSGVGIDVSAEIGSLNAAAEGQTGIATVSVQSQGLFDPQNLVTVVEVSAPLRLTEISSPQWTCELQTAQRAHCTRANLSSTSYLSFKYVADTAGEYAVTATVTADNDAVPQNNVANFDIVVATFLDVGISTPASARDIVAGTPIDVIYTVTTGAHPVPGVRFTASTSKPFYEVVSVNIPGHVCQENGGVTTCDLGDLPANANLQVNVRYSAPGGGTYSSGAPVGVQTVRDSNPANNVATVQMNTYMPTDLQVQVAQTTAAAVNGTALTFPRITVTNLGPALAGGVTLEIPLPAFASVQSMSSGVTCAGTSILVCDIQVLTFNGFSDSQSIDITLATTGQGTFTSLLTLRAVNDSNASNNTAQVALSSTASGGGGSSSGGSSSGGGSSGGGGGGRLEWLALAVLGLLAMRRTTRSAATG